MAFLSSSVDRGENASACVRACVCMCVVEDEERVQVALGRVRVRASLRMSICPGICAHTAVRIRRHADKKHKVRDPKTRR